MIFAVAASILIVVGVSTWAMLRRHDQQIARAVVDLRDRSLARGTEPPPTELPLEIPRNVSHLDSYLPLGSNDGVYDTRLATRTGQEVSTGRAAVELHQGIAVLSWNVNLSAPPGVYVLQVRRIGSEWSSFSVRIK